MGRLGIDYESVREAAEGLVASGETATVERVRAALGSGSFTTLGRHLRTWRRTQASSGAREHASPQDIHNAAQALWETLSEAAEARAAEAHEAARSAVEDIQATTKEQLAAMAAELQHSQQRHEIAASHTEARLQDLQRDKQLLQQRLAESEQGRLAAEVQAKQNSTTVEQLQRRLMEMQQASEKQHSVLQAAQIQLQHQKADYEQAMTARNQATTALQASFASEQALAQKMRKQLEANLAQAAAHADDERQRRRQAEQHDDTLARLCSELAETQKAVAHGQQVQQQWAQSQERRVADLQAQLQAEQLKLAKDFQTKALAALQALGDATRLHINLAMRALESEDEQPS